VGFTQTFQGNWERKMEGSIQFLSGTLGTRYLIGLCPNLSRQLGEEDGREYLVPK